MEQIQETFDPYLWPRNERGDFICSAKQPMPNSALDLHIKGRRWEHDDVRETDYDSDYYIEYKCHSCGHKWKSEMPD